MIDLYTVYKLTKQRAAKSTDAVQKQLAELAAASMKEVLEDPSEINAIVFTLTEQDYIDCPRTKANVIPYAEKVLDAIRSNTWTSSKPKMNLPGLNNNDPEKGYLYVATSEMHPGQFKIGFTKLDLNKRMQLYRSRYGYKLEVAISALTEYPARLEKELQATFKDLRVRGRTTKGISNEWYYGKVNLPDIYIDIVSKQLGLKIYNKTWS